MNFIEKGSKDILKINKHKSVNEIQTIKIQSKVINIDSIFNETDFNLKLYVD